MNQVTISLHKIDLDSHIDIFFDVHGEEKLQTYTTQAKNWEFLREGGIITCVKKEDHRKIYLTYEGEISNNRGNLKILWQGKYSNQNQFFKKFIKLKFENKSVLIL